MDRFIKIFNTLDYARNNLGNHTSKDFTEVYEFLINRYGMDQSCPAILLMDTKEPAAYKSSNGHEVIILDRNSETLKRDLKKLIRKSAISLDHFSEKLLTQIWDPGRNHGVLYKVAYDICQYLQIEMPALFFYTHKYNDPLFISIAYPSQNESKPASDVYICFDSEFDDKRIETVYLIKTLLHELRHAWQFKYHPDWFCGYTYPNYNNSECKETLNYQLHKTEIDAEAFSYWFLEKKAKFNMDSLDPEVTLAIRKRIDEIKQECKHPSLSW